MRRFLLSIKASVTHPAMPLCTLAFVLACSLYLVMGRFTGIAGYQMEMETALAYMDTRESILSDPAVPDELKALTEQELAALEDAQAATTEAEWIAGVAAYHHIQLETYDAGYLSGPSRPILQRAETLFSALASLEDPHLYASTSDLPGLLYVGTAVACAPMLIWCLPGLCIAWCTTRLTDSRKLLARTPRTGHRDALLATSLAITLSIVIPLLLIGVIVLIATLKNGLGDPAYPVLFDQGGSLVQTTALGLTLRACAAFILITCTTSLIVLFAHSVCRNSTLATACALFVCLLASQITPVLADLVPAQDSWSAWAYCPLPYLNAAGLAGGFWYGPTEDVLPIPGASFTAGAIALGVTCAVLALGSIGVSTLAAHIKRAPAKEASHAHSA